MGLGAGVLGGGCVVVLMLIDSLRKARQTHLGPIEGRFRPPAWRACCALSRRLQRLQRPAITTACTLITLGKAPNLSPTASCFLPCLRLSPIQALHS